MGLAPGSCGTLRGGAWPAVRWCAVVRCWRAKRPHSSAGQPTYRMSAADSESAIMPQTGNRATHVAVGRGALYRCVQP